MREKIFGNTHFFALVLCLLFPFVQSQAGTEICISVGQTSVDVTDISINSPLTVTQVNLSSFSLTHQINIGLRRLC